MKTEDDKALGAQGAAEVASACPVVPASTASHAVCVCGNGWTFDFVSKRVYCRACEAQEKNDAIPLAKS